MPEISRFFGIVVTMYHRDHGPAHFHVRYGEHRAVVGIESLGILQGKLPARVHVLVVEWGLAHRPELRANWIRAQALEPLMPIAPLE